MLGERDPLHYGTLTLAELEHADRRVGARSWVSRRAAFRRTPSPSTSSACTRCAAQVDGRDPQPGRVDALRLLDPRRARADGAAGRRGAPLRHPVARAVAAAVGDRRPLPRDVSPARARRATGSRLARLREELGRHGDDRVAGRHGERSGEARDRTASARSVSRRAARARDRSAARRHACQRALPDGLHGHERTGADRCRAAGRRATGSSPTFATPPSRPRRYRTRSSARSSRATCSRASSRRSPHRERGGGRLGFDDASLTVKQHARLVELLGEGWELVPCAGVVEGLRAVKDAGEIDRIRAASRAGRRGLAGNARSRPRRSHRARRRDRAGAAHAPSRRRGPELPLDRRRRRPRRPAARRRRAHARSVRTCWSRSTGARCTRATARTARARTRPESGSPRGRGRSMSSSSRPRNGRSPRSGLGPNGKEVDAVAREVIERGGGGRALRPRPRPRRRDRGPRGAAPVAPGKRGSAAGRERGDGRAGGVPARAARRADRGSRRRDRGRSGGADAALQGAHGRRVARPRQDRPGQAQ